MGVAVNDEIQPGDLFIQVIGAIRNGGFVHAEVSKADNHVCAGCLERVDLRLRVLPDGRLGRIGQEGQTLDERRIGLCLRLGRLHAEEADLDAALFDDLVCLEDGLVLRIKHIGAENREFRLLHVFLKLRIAIVKLVVAEADHVIAGQVHQLHSIRALAQGDGRVALAEIARVGQNDVGAGLFKLCLERGHIGISQNLAVHVV